MDQQDQTPADNKSQPSPSVEVDWINFRSDKGRSDYGDHRCSISVSKDEINHLRTFVSKCHSDTDPAPDEDQFYFFSLSTKDGKRWVMLRSQNNFDLMAQGERKGRIFNAVLLSGDCLQRIFPDGNPLHLINLPTFDVVGELADELNPEYHTGVDYRAQGRPLPISAHYPVDNDKKSSTPISKQEEYDPDAIQELFKKITIDCAENVLPPTFATWWSSLRPLPEPNPFQYLFISPQPQQPIERGEALSKALRLNETVHQIVVPDQLGKQAFQLWTDTTRLSENLCSEMSNIFDAAAQDRSVWANGWPRICRRATTIAQKLKQLSDRMIDTNYEHDYRLVSETVEKYKTLSSDLRSVRPPSLSTKAVASSEVIPEYLDSDTKTTVLRSIVSSPKSRWSIIVCLILLLGVGIYVGLKRFQTNGSIVSNWSNRDEVINDALNSCTVKIEQFVKREKLYSGYPSVRETNKQKLKSYIATVVAEVGVKTYDNRRSEVFIDYQANIDSSPSQTKKTDLGTKRDEYIKDERAKLIKDVAKQLQSKYIDNFAVHFSEIDEPKPKPNVIEEDDITPQDTPIKTPKPTVKKTVKKKKKTSDR